MVHAPGRDLWWIGAPRLWDSVGFPLELNFSPEHQTGEPPESSQQPHTRGVLCGR
jgi:hypothetical protein